MKVKIKENVFRYPFIVHSAEIVALAADVATFVSIVPRSIVMPLLLSPLETTLTTRHCNTDQKYNYPTAKEPMQGINKLMIYTYAFK